MILLQIVQACFIWVSACPTVSAMERDEINYHNKVENNLVTIPDAKSEDNFVNNLLGVDTKSEPNTSETSLRFMMLLYEKMSSGEMELPDNIDTVSSVAPDASGTPTSKLAPLKYTIEFNSRDHPVTSLLHIEGSRAPRRHARIVVSKGSADSVDSDIIAPLLSLPMEIDISSLVQRTGDDTEELCIYVREQHLRRSSWVTNMKHLNRKPPLILIYGSDDFSEQNKTTEDELATPTPIEWYERGSSQEKTEPSRRRRSPKWNSNDNLGNDVRQFLYDPEKYIDASDKSSIRNDRRHYSKPMLKLRKNYYAQNEIEDEDRRKWKKIRRKKLKKMRRRKKLSRKKEQKQRDKVEKDDKFKFVQEEYPHLGSLLPPLEVYGPLPWENDLSSAKKANLKKKSKMMSQDMMMDMPESQSSIQSLQHKEKTHIKNTRKSNSIKSGGTKIPKQWIDIALNQGNLKFGMLDPASGASAKQNTQHPNSIINPLTINKGKCSKRYFYIDFKSFGWDRFIIAPKGFSASHCAGYCTSPVTVAEAGTNHAIVQSLMRILDMRNHQHDEEIPTTIPKACCVPQKLNALTVLVARKSTFVLRYLPDMEVESCGCV